MVALLCTGKQQGTINVRTAVSEFFGTCALVVVGAGTAAVVGGQGAAGVHTIGAAFGLTVTALMYSMSHAGASQFNPIVSVALAICSHLSAAQMVVNIFFQCAGSVLAGFLLAASINVSPLAPNGTIDMSGALGANHKQTAAVTDGHAFMAEAGGSFFLCMVVINCLSNNGSKGKVGTDAAPVAVGFMVYALHLLLGPITGCSINPARSTGPAVVSNMYVDELWIFWAAPMVGGIACGILGRFIFVVDHEKEDIEIALRAKEDAVDAENARLLKAKAEGLGGGGGASVSPDMSTLVIGDGVPASMQGIVDMLTEMREEIHHLHENEQELVLDTKGSD